MQKYNKFWVALGTAVVAGLSQYFGADSTWVTLAVTILGAAGVYATPNKG